MDRTNMKRLTMLLASTFALSLAACGDKGSGDESGSTTAPTSSSSGEAGETGDASSGSTSTGISTTSDGSGFVNSDMNAACGESCDIWTPGDCGSGQKCTSVGCEVGTTAWDSNVCRDIQGSKQLGDECEYLGTGIDGNDDCDDGLMCWNQNADTGLGLCVAFCTGSAAAPNCASPNICVIANDGVLPICLPQCDPLVQDCDNGDLCVPDFNENGFVCVLDASGGMSPYGAPCQYANGCNPGLMCIASDSVPEPECATAAGCCSPMCDLNEPNTCPGSGQECQALYQPGNAPPGFDHMGVCAVPA